MTYNQNRGANVACDKLDKKRKIFTEINLIENKLTKLRSEWYEIAMNCKMLNHRLADLKYELKQFKNENG